MEKVAKEQLQAELWDIISNVLKDDKMVSTLCYRFKEGLTLDETGQRLGITREMVRQYESKALRRLRCNSRTKQLGNALGLDRSITDIERFKYKVEQGHTDWLSDKEFKYAVHMGWIKEDRIQGMG